MSISLREVGYLLSVWMLNDFWPWAMQKTLGGETLTITKMSDLPAEAVRDRESFDHFGTQSVVAVPLSVGRGKAFGLLTFSCHAGGERLAGNGRATV